MNIKRIVKKGSRRLAVLGTVGSILVIAGYVIAVLLLTQTVPVTTAASIVSTTCVDGSHPLTGNVSFYVQGKTTYVRFTCAADANVGYTTKGGIVATPTFSLPSPFTQLWSFQQSTAVGTTCAGGTGAWQMTSGSAHTFPGPQTTWDYCALIPNTGTGDSSSFAVAWSA